MPRRNETFACLDPWRPSPANPRVEIQSATTRVEAAVRLFRHGGSTPPGSMNETSEMNAFVSRPDGPRDRPDGEIGRRASGFDFGMAHKSS